MNKSLRWYAFMIFAFALSSCAKTVYTHQQVMQEFRTRDQVLKKLGEPDQKVKTGLIDEWIYNRDTDAKRGPLEKNEMSPVIGKTDSLNANQPQLPDKYIRFIFNEKGDVLGYKTQGVDMGKTEKAGFFTTLFEVIGATVVIAVVVFLQLVEDGYYY